MFNIVENFKKLLILPIIILIAGIVMFSINGGFETDIDFAGGTMMQLDMEKEFKIDDVKAVVKDTLGIEDAVIQSASDEVAKNQVIIKTETLDSQQRDKLYEAVKEKFALTKAKEETIISSDSITPLVSSEIIYNAILAVVIAVVLILIYISFRFTFTSGVAAVITLLHDVIIMLCVYAVLRLPVNASFVAAILTIIGYSINDTIVIFDRIRENKKFAKKETFAEICNKSVKQTIRRSLNTAGTTAVTLIILSILGEDSIRAFTIPLIIGTIAGSYSSIFIAAPLWCLFEGKDKKKKA